MNESTILYLALVSRSLVSSESTINPEDDTISAIVLITNNNEQKNAKNNIIKSNSIIT